MARLLVVFQAQKKNGHGSWGTHGRFHRILFGQSTPTENSGARAVHTAGESPVARNNHGAKHRCVHGGEACSGRRNCQRMGLRLRGILPIPRKIRGYAAGFAGLH
jgi:hypothetical protein